MKARISIIIGLMLIALSQLFMSFGYEFLMAQRPIDYAHWFLLLGAILLFALWFELPENGTKLIGLSIMTLGIAGIVGMCTIDFFLWAADGNGELKKGLFDIISNTPSIKYPFLIVGPSLFYTGICIATYGLFLKFKWQVLVVNVGALFIGLGHMIFHNRVIPVVGAVMLFVGLVSTLTNSHKK